MSLEQTHTIHLSGHDPRLNLQFEEALFDRLRRQNQAACLFYTNNPSVILGRNNKPDEWVNLEATTADNIPVLHRFSGGGTVYHDRQVLNYSFILPKNILDQKCSGLTPRQGATKYIDFFLGIVIEALSNFGQGLALSRTSDIVLHEKKISGNAQRIAGGLVLHHGTLLLECPLHAIEKYLQIPPDRQGIEHGLFVSGLTDMGWKVNMAKLKAVLASRFWQTVCTMRVEG